MVNNCVRSIVFTIPGVSGAPDVEVLAVEDNGKLVFTVNVLDSAHITADLRGLFFNLNDSSTKLAGLTYTGADVTDFDTVNVIDLGNGANMHGAVKSFDVGLEFGTQGIDKDNIQTTSFTLSNTANDLSLDDIAHTLFGARLTSVGDPLDNPNGSAKLTVTAPAAPDAVADAYTIFEDGQSALNDPSTVPKGVLFEVIANDTDGDGDTLTITGVHGAKHGTVEIVDGADADLLPGDAVLYTPFEDYSGTDAFTYCVTDNNGGTDYASVDVTVTPVADVPSLSYEVLAGDTVDQMRVVVTATQTDADSSEFMDRIELSGIPADVTVVPSEWNPGSEPDQVVQEFLLTLPQGEDVAFDLGITAVSKETSNGDEESAFESILIKYDETQNHFDPIFEVEDQSMWSDGDAFSISDDRFLGIDDNFSGSTGGDFYASYDIDYKIGLQSSLDVSGGEVDASAFYSVDINTFYNETTDWLRFETDSDIKLAQSSFSTESPLLEYELDLITQALGDLTFGVDVDIPGIPGTDAVEIFGVEVIPAIPDIPGFSLGASTDIDVDIDNSTTLMEFDGDSLNLFGLEGDSALNMDLGNGFYLDAEIPHFNTSSEVSGTHLVSSGSADFLTLKADIDEIIFKLLVEPNPFSQSKNFADCVEVGYDIINYELQGALGVGQEFSMDFGDLNGKLEFEDGAIHEFTLGDDIDFFNASTHDVNQDGDLDFSVSLTPDAEFSSNLFLSLQLNHVFEALKASVTVDAPFPFDDPEYNLGPVYDYEDTLIGTSIDLVGLPSFDFDLGSTTENMVA